MEKITIDNSTLQRISIMIDIMIIILRCSYSDTYSIIIKSKTFAYLQQKDYATLHDSPQANSASIGEELRNANNILGTKITNASIKEAMRIMRNKTSDKGNYKINT